MVALVVFLFMAMGAVLGVAWIVGGIAAAPWPAEIGAPPDGMPVQSVSFSGGHGGPVHGWFVDGAPGRGVVVLFHGVRTNRLAMADRARFLNASGYSVLLIDFQAHGESPGSQITFGHLESLNAAAAMRYAKARLPGEPVAAIGLSLGGAAVLLGEAKDLADALVLEAVFPTFYKAASNRMAIRFGEPSRLLTPFLLWQVPFRLGVSPEDLRPIDGIARVRVPVLVIAAGRDRRTTPADSQALHAAAPNPKAFWMLEDADHGDFHRHAPEAYEQRVLDFLETALAPQSRR